MNDIKNTAAHFCRKGIGAGDRVLILEPMSVRLYISVLSLFYLGATAVFLDAWVNRSRMETCCRIADCRGLIASRKIIALTVFSAELRRIPVKLATKKAKHTDVIPMYDPPENHPALITFTTGSTGIPKAAIRTHGILKAQFEALAPLLPENSITLTMLPIVILMNLGKGVTSVIPQHKKKWTGNMNIRGIYRQSREQHINTFILSPYYLICLAKYIVRNNLPPPPVKNIISGGGPVFPDDARIIFKAFPDAEFTIVYGSTEAEPISHVNFRNLINRESEMDCGLFAGKISSEAEVLVVACSDAGLTSVDPLPAGTTGEIIVSGNHVVSSYLKNEDAFSRNKICVHNKIWHRTGDAGYLTSSNDLYLVGRCDQILSWENRIYYPFLIEYFLRKIKGIISGTLIKINSRPVVAIQVDHDFNAAELTDKMKKHALHHFEVVVLNKMPMDPRHHSKIDYLALSRELTEKKSMRSMRFTEDADRNDFQEPAKEMQ